MVLSRKRLFTIFQLTPSRRATLSREDLMRRLNISTHALTEGDKSRWSACRDPRNFNSRPHGGRPVLRYRILPCRIFQLTPSRRATEYAESYQPFMLFQLTPSRRATPLRSTGSPYTLFQLTPSRRATRNACGSKSVSPYFNSRPHGGRRRTQRIQPLQQRISTHALTEGDVGQILSIFNACYFNSRPHGGRRTVH